MSISRQDLTRQAFAALANASEKFQKKNTNRLRQFHGCIVKERYEQLKPIASDYRLTRSLPLRQMR
jgi:hypothetical protein